MWEAFEVRMRKLVRFGPVLESLLCLLPGWPSEQREREGEALRRRAEAAEPHTRHGQHEEREPGSKSEAVAARDGADQPRWRSEGENEWEEEADLFYFVFYFSLSLMLNVMSSSSGAVPGSWPPATGSAGEVGGWEGGVQENQETRRFSGKRAARHQGAAGETGLSAWGGPTDEE